LAADSEVFERERERERERALWIALQIAKEAFSILAAKRGHTKAGSGDRRFVAKRGKPSKARFTSWLMNTGRVEGATAD
jgi:hypothetical protein